MNLFICFVRSHHQGEVRIWRGEQKRMVTSLSVLAFLVSFLFTSAIPEKEQSEVICSSDACYTVHLSKEFFSEASKTCVNMGGNLLSIHDEEEAGHVYSLLWKFTNTTLVTGPLKLWIGLRLKRSCVISSEALRGFSWITDTQHTNNSQFSNWLTEPKKTCIKEKCVSMILQMDSPDNYKWTDELCSSLADGYICKFNFQGMCHRVVLAGPGYVEYETPFSFRSFSLDFVPHGSSASVSCGHNGEEALHLFCMKSAETNVYHWDSYRMDKKSKGPFCASEELGCKYNNGGCEHECVEYPQNRSLSCRCRDGYVLAPDLVSCVYPDHCKSNPCGQKCINHQHCFECSCSPGFELAENKADCIDVNECLKGSCSQTCINTLGSFYCKCNTGFQQQGSHCIDIDECINSNCSQSCLNTHGSYRCSCITGYTITSDNITCLDVDECAHSPCAHYCHNTNGSYVCSCPKGMLLSSDHISCISEQNSDAFSSGEINGLEPEEATSSSTDQSTPNFTDATMDLQDNRETGQMMHSTPMPQELDLPGNSSVYQVTSDHKGSNNTVLLLSILCACAVLLLIMIIIGAVLCHKKRNAKKNETEKQPSATDNYCWVPEQKGEKTANNEYR